MQMNAADLLDLVMIVTRGTVLIIAALGAVLSIYFGWSLHRDLVRAPLSVELSAGKAWRGKLVAEGPGAAFALFGMILLVCLVRQSILIEDSIPIPISEESTADAPTSLLESAPPLVTEFTLAAFQPVSNRPTVKRVESRLCLVAVRKRRFMDGGSLSPDKIRKDLRAAIMLLVKINTAGLSDADRAARADAVDTLEDMIESTGSWPLP